MVYGESGLKSNSCKTQNTYRIVLFRFLLSGQNTSFKYNVSPQQFTLGKNHISVILEIYFWHTQHLPRFFVKLKVLSSGWAVFSPSREGLHKQYMWCFSPVNFSDCMQKRKVTAVPAGGNAFSHILSRPLPRDYRFHGQVPFTMFVTILPSV